MSGPPDAAPQTRGAEAVPTGWVMLGRIIGVYGIKGWVKIESFTRPREAIFDYGPWRIGKGSEEEGYGSRVLTGGRPQGKGLVAGIEGIDDRDQAQMLIGATIAIPRAQLPQADEGEVYWADLIGCRVANNAGVDFGKVAGMMETGANDVMVVEGVRRRLIPYIPDVVRSVDLADRRVLVEWDEDF